MRAEYGADQSQYTGRDVPFQRELFPQGFSENQGAAAAGVSELYPDKRGGKNAASDKPADTRHIGALRIPGSFQF